VLYTIIGGNKINMKKIELDDHTLSNITGGKRTSDGTHFSSTSDLGKCVLSFFKNCN